MREQITELDPDTAALFATIDERPVLDPAVYVADGHGVTLTTSRNHLVIKDCPGMKPRTLRLHRTDRTIRRIIVVGDTGHVTMNAAHWCKEAGVTGVCVTRDGHEYMRFGAPEPTDIRLRRAQMECAPGGRYERAGLDFARSALRAKIAGQADVVESILGQPVRADAMRTAADGLDRSRHVADVMGHEGNAAGIGWNEAWNGSVEVRFRQRDEAKIPARWQVFMGRESVISGTNRHASDPVNAMLNYGYRLAETECRLACLTYGLDPQAGFLHNDRDGRDSLVCDLVETVRPHVERAVLGILGYGPDGEHNGRKFRADDFTQTPEGACRVNAPITHEIAEHARVWAAVAGEHAAHIRDTLAKLADGSVPVALTADRTKVRPLAADRPHAPRKTRAASGAAPSAPKRRPAVPVLPQGLTLEQILPDRLWAEIRPHMPAPRQLNKADQRTSLRRIVAGIYLQHVHGVPGKHLPAIVADRKTVRDRMRRWEADGRWDTLRPMLERHAAGHPLNLTA